MARYRAEIEQHLDRLTLREDDIVQLEIMISESQERMVAVVLPERVADVVSVLERWELAWAEIGEVTETGELRCFHDGELVAEIPARLLTDEAPRYDVPQQPHMHPRAAPRPSPPLRARLGDPNIASKRWIYEQYDQLVGSRTVRRPGLDAAVLRLRPSLRGLAVSLDAPQPGETSAFATGTQAVFEAALNVACAGGKPLALTDCLNFGNPEKAEIGWELEQAIEGIALAAEALEIPVVSGNVSLYNETDGRAIPPTPVVGCVGLVADVRTVPRGWSADDAVAVVDAPARSDFDGWAELVRRVWQAAPLVTLAHDVGAGGLDVALVEAALWSGVGADVEAITASAGSVVFACAPHHVDELGLRRIGTVGGDALLGHPLAELHELMDVRG